MEKLMGKSNSILNKALNEADTIRTSALKNAEDILFQAFSPKFQRMFDSYVNEQVGTHNQDPMDGPDGSFDQSDKEAHDNLDPNDSPIQDGEGPELLEQEEVEDDDIEEQTEGDEDVDDLDEQEEEDDWVVDEIDSIVEQDEEEDMDEQFGDDDEDDVDEQAEEDDEIIEVVEDDDDEIDEAADDEEDEGDDEVEEQLAPAATAATTKTEQLSTLKAENALLRKKYNKVVKENNDLAKGVLQLSRKVKQINLFNAKVACANSILSSKGIDEDIKVTALRSLDKCKRIAEVKVAFNSFKSLLTLNKKKNATLRESRNLNSIRNKNVASQRSTQESYNDTKQLRLAGLID